jgi:hypothetical protein
MFITWSLDVHYCKKFAGFEMIRYFIQTYTNRKHTRLRQEFGVNDAEINKVEKINISSILIVLFLCPNEAKKLSANFSETALLFLLISASLTRELKIFYNNTHPVTK